MAATDLTEHLLKMLKELQTLVLERDKKELEEAKIPKRLYHTTEGSFSAYVDAVSKTVASSSYDISGIKLPLNRVSKLAMLFKELKVT